MVPESCIQHVHVNIPGARACYAARKDTDLYSKPSSCSPTKRRKELEHLATKEGQIRDYVNAIDQSTSIFL